MEKQEEQKDLFLTIPSYEGGFGAPFLFGEKLSRPAIINSFRLLIIEHSLQFLALTGAQETLMFFRAAQTCLEHSIFSFLGQRAIEQSGNTQKGLRENSESI